MHNISQPNTSVKVKPHDPGGKLSMPWLNLRELDRRKHNPRSNSDLVVTSDLRGLGVPDERHARVLKCKGGGHLLNKSHTRVLMCREGVFVEQTPRTVNKSQNKKRKPARSGHTRKRTAPFASRATPSASAVHGKSIRASAQTISVKLGLGRADSSGKWVDSRPLFSRAAPIKGKGAARGEDVFGTCIIGASQGMYEADTVLMQPCIWRGRHDNNSMLFCGYF
jgi:hypothetical protein